MKNTFQILKIIFKKFSKKISKNFEKFSKKFSKYLSCVTIHNQKSAHRSTSLINKIS